MEKSHFLRYTYTHLRLLYNKDLLNKPCELSVNIDGQEQMLFQASTMVEVVLNDAVYFLKMIRYFSWIERSGFA